MSEAPKIMDVTKQVEFAAAHRLFRDDWSEEKNRDVFGLCANPYGHGHNYLLEVTVTGPVDEATGMVVHFASLKRLLEECVVRPLDHQHLNYVPLLQGKLPTSENLIACLWQELTRATAAQPWKLTKLRLGSTARNWVEYRG